MKKIVLATILSVASITASAQVTLYGNLRGFVDNTSVNGQSTTSMVSDLSRWGISASERISKDLQARAVIETSIASTDPLVGDDTKIGNRQSTVGLVGRMGSVDLGRAFNSYFLTVTNNDPFGTHYGSIAGDVHNVRTVRSGDAVFVNLNAGPLAVAVDRTVNGVAEVTTGSVGGSVGPVRATVSQFKAGNDKSTVIGTQTRFMGTQVFATFSDSTTNGQDSRGSLVGVSRDLGVTTLKASYGKRTGDVVAYNLGADYALSKRTAVSVALRNVNGTVDIRQMGLGLTHKF